MTTTDRAEQAKALIAGLHDRVVGDVHAYAAKEHLTHEGAIRAAVRMGAEAALTASEAEVTRLQAGIAEANKRWTIHIEQDCEFLQQVADSYGIRRDEVTVNFLARKAEALSQPTTDTNGAHA